MTIPQPLALTPDGVWTCAWCAAGLNGSKIQHRENCRWIAEIRDTATIPDRQEN